MGWHLSSQHLQVHCHRRSQQRVHTDFAALRFAVYVCRWSFETFTRPFQTFTLMNVASKILATIFRPLVVTVLPTGIHNTPDLIFIQAVGLTSGLSKV